MKIDIVAGHDAGKQFEFDGQAATIGREADCEIRIRDEQSSRRHCKIEPRGYRLIATDLQSTNGTLVNGQRIGDCLLSDGDEITIGRTVLRVSGVPSKSAGDTVRLQMTDHQSSVVMALHHREADLLSSKTSAETPEDVVRENAILREICGISHIVAAEPDPQVVLTSILNRIHEAVEADTTCVLSRADDGEAWEITERCDQCAGEETVHVSKTIVNEAVKEGHAILAADPLSDDRFGSSQSIVVQSISSALCCPMKVGNEFGCVLWVDRRKKRNVFSAMDLRLAASAANIAGLFLEKKEYEEASIKRARLAAIGEVVAGLAHYIKNVVTGFRLSIDALKSAVKSQRMDYVATFADSASKQEGRISELMLNMLTYAKERQPELAPLELESLIEGLVEPYRGQFEKDGIRFSLECDPATPAVLAEEMSLHRAFLNLLTNSHVSVMAKPEDGEKLIRAKTTPDPDGDGVLVSFYDTGSGIPRDKLGKIFEAFYSTKGSGGTGLGLAVVQKIVEEHNGTIAVDSEEGQWTEFRITLPAAEN